MFYFLLLSFVLINPVYKEKNTILLCQPDSVPNERRVLNTCRGSRSLVLLEAGSWF